MNTGQNSPIDPFQEERDAIERIGLTADGLLLHRYLRRVLEMIPADLSHGALEVDTGRRSLARNLMVILAAGIEANRERSDDPVIRNASKPVRVIGHPGGRRVQLTPGDGWGGGDTGSGNQDPIGPDPDAA